jgi:hypothetical protein
MISDFKERLQEEQSDLQEKITKLNRFIGTESFDKIDDVQQALLRTQLQVMLTYQTCLDERLYRL